MVVEVGVGGGVNNAEGEGEDYHELLLQSLAPC